MCSLAWSCIANCPLQNGRILGQAEGLSGLFFVVPARLLKESEGPYSEQNGVKQLRCVVDIVTSKLST